MFSFLSCINGHGLFIFLFTYSHWALYWNFQQGDVDGNGTLDCDEFVTVTVHLKKISSDDDLTKAFKFFDKNESGFIEIEELREALQDGDFRPENEQAIRDIISDVDTDKVGFENILIV